MQEEEEKNHSFKCINYIRYFLCNFSSLFFPPSSSWEWMHVNQFFFLFSLKVVTIFFEQERENDCHVQVDPFELVVHWILVHTDALRIPNCLLEDCLMEFVFLCHLDAALFSVPTFGSHIIRISFSCSNDKSFFLATCIYLTLCVKLSCYSSIAAASSLFVFYCILKWSNESP